LGDVRFRAAEMPAFAAAMGAKRVILAVSGMTAFETETV
jgi:hypothetical protein